MNRKRLFDIIFSLATLVFLSPLFIFIGIAIKCSSKGPIFYRSYRVKKDFAIFPCWKFRTMYEGAEARLEKILKENPHMCREWNTYRKMQQDPRITPLGRFLRKTSLDEFPQFLNVLLGDLSLVGPRPYFQEEIDLYVKEKAKKILSVRPGLTGIWQTSGRNTLSIEERIALDEKYLETQSFFLDFKIILKTIKQIFGSYGAY